MLLRVVPWSSVLKDPCNRLFSGTFKEAAHGSDQNLTILPLPMGHSEYLETMFHPDSNPFQMNELFVFFWGITKE